MSTEVLSPREAGRFVAENAVNVKILQQGVDALSEKILKVIEADPKELSVDRWSLHELLPQTRDEAALNWVFVSHVLNFSFWCEGDVKFSVVHKGKEWTGYWSLCAAICRAIEEGHDVREASVMACMQEKTFQHIFRSHTACHLPLMSERLQALREAGLVLRDKFGGKFVNMIREAGGSAVTLVRMVVQNFSSFRDEVSYGGKKLGIYKRAQIVVGDAWACMGGREPCSFDDIDLVTAFADYRVPQALNWLGVLHYEPEMMRLLETEHELEYGEEKEVEIRGCTIHAVELLVERVNEKLRGHESLKGLKVNSIMMDHYLWDLRRSQNCNMPHVPFHKTRCIYY